VENALQVQGREGAAGGNTDTAEMIRQLVSTGMDERFAELDNVSVIKGARSSVRGGARSDSSRISSGIENSVFGPALSWTRKQLSHSLVRGTVLLLLSFFATVFVFRLFGVRCAEMVPVASAAAGQLLSLTREQAARVGAALGAVEWRAMQLALRQRIQGVVLLLEQFYKGILWKYHGLDPEL